jgi:hypothetical protein
VSDTSSELVEVGVVAQDDGALSAYECGTLFELVDELTTKVATDDRSDCLNARLGEGATLQGHRRDR